jgi:hypothetical protein
MGWNKELVPLNEEESSSLSMMFFKNKNKEKKVLLTILYVWKSDS